MADSTLAIVLPWTRSRALRNTEVQILQGMPARQRLTADVRVSCDYSVIVPAFLTALSARAKVRATRAAASCAFVCGMANGRRETMAVSKFHRMWRGEPTSLQQHFSRSERFQKISS